MGKIAPVSAKYIVHADITTEGIVDRPDVIGAVFGQTEGLLGSDLELRELQRSGRIGRIEVDIKTNAGKSSGTIIVPSSLDKAETAIIAAALETIERIGPCNSKVLIKSIEDVRISKRNHVIERAKELLHKLTDNVLPDSQEIADQVMKSVRMMELGEYGKDRLPCGPGIEDAEEILLVEGRADVLNLLKHGIKNVIGMAGTNIPLSLLDISKKKTLIAFVDGDRGGDLIIRGLTSAGVDLDFVIKAPDGKEVEELTNKELHKAMRSKVAFEQSDLEKSNGKPASRTVSTAARPASTPSKSYQQRGSYQRNNNSSSYTPRAPSAPPKSRVTPELAKHFKTMLDDLVGTRGAYILDKNMNILGKVPTTELESTLSSLGTGVYAIILDGDIEKSLAQVSEKNGVKYLVAKKFNMRPSETRVEIITPDNL